MINENMLEIAKHLGYHVWFHETPNDMNRGWKVLNQDDSAVCGALGFASENDAWNAFFSIRHFQWDSDFSAAWRLLRLLPEDVFVSTMASLRGMDDKRAAKEVVSRYLKFVKGE